MNSEDFDFDLDKTLGSDAGKTAVTERNLGLWFRVGLGALVAAAFLAFVFQNTDSVDVNFLGWSVSVGQSILMVLCGVAGVVIWEIAGFLSRRMRSSD